MRSQIYIRSPTPDDQREFLAAARRSKSFHRPWVTAPVTPKAFRLFLAQIAPPVDYAFLVCLRDGGDIAGVINVTNIVLGAFRRGIWVTTRSKATNVVG